MHRRDARGRTYRVVVALHACLMLMGGFGEPACSVEIIAHRGASGLAPENTYAAVSLAWRLGAHAVEIDVRLTRDGHIVAMHDATTKRTAGRDLAVADSTLAQLRALDAGSWKGATWAGQKIPTLEEILATVPADKRLFIELKSTAEILPELQRVLKRSGTTPSQTAIISFDLDTLRAVKKRMPRLKVYWVHESSPKRDEKTGQIVRDKRTGRLIDPPDELIEKCRRAKIDGLDLKADSQFTREMVERTHGLGLELYVWTVDQPEEANRLIELGVDGITTNRPETFVKERR